MLAVAALILASASVLAVGALAFHLQRIQTPREVIERVERVERDRVEWLATMNGFAERCDDVLDAAETKRRRAAASLSAIDRKKPGQSEPTFQYIDEMPPDQQRAAVRAIAARRNGAG